MGVDEGFRAIRDPTGSIKRAWKRLRNGGSSGYPVYGGTGAAMAITRKFLCAGIKECLRPSSGKSAASRRAYR